MSNKFVKSLKRSKVKVTWIILNWVYDKVFLYAVYGYTQLDSL